MSLLRASTSSRDTPWKSSSISTTTLSSLTRSLAVLHQQSEPVAEVSASANVLLLLDLVPALPGAHTAGVIKIIFVAHNSNHSSDAISHRRGLRRIPSAGTTKLEYLFARA